MSSDQKPSLGRVVHYVIALSHDGEPVIQPAMVVACWPDSVNLQVLVDGQNVNRSKLPPRSVYAPDDAECAAGLAWRTSAHHSDAKAPGTWHWPPRV